MDSLSYGLLLRIASSNKRLREHDLSPEERGALSDFRQKGFVVRNLNGEIFMRPSGYSALAAEKERLEREEHEQAEQDAARRAERAYLDQQTQKHFRHDWRIAAFQLVGSFILGAVADHFFDIVGYALRLWPSLFHG